MSTNAAAEQRIDQRLDERTFGNLSKLVPLTILSASIGVALVIAVLNGLDYAGLIEAAQVLATGTGLAAVGSVTAWLGKSQTQLDAKAATVTLPAEDGQQVAALPAGSPLIAGHFNGGEPAPEETVTDPVEPEPAEPVDLGVTVEDYDTTTQD